MNAVLYQLEKVSKVFAEKSAGADGKKRRDAEQSVSENSGADALCILDEIDLEIRAGESVSIVGASGSGKSTLLHILGTLDTPTSGLVRFKGKLVSALSAEEKAAFRNRCLGFVFQFHHLLPEFSALENVAMQAVIGGMPRRLALEKAREALELVGLTNRAAHSVSTMSGGERQRAAIARAILNKPEVLLADEPTGNLDEKNGRQVADLLHDLNAKLGTTLVIVTHNLELARSMHTCLELRGGKLHPAFE